MNKIVVAGKRKTSIAKATIEDGNGEILINKKPVAFLPELQRLELEEPLMIAKSILKELKFNISVNVKGGGNSSKIEASRLSIARAILKFSKDNEELRTAFLAYDRNLLVADTRRKEAYKPGDSKARSKRQSSKR
jgi:small subunit ribosomal protein S9